MDKAAKKKARNSRGSSKDNKSDETESDIDVTNFGDHITYDVLRMIFEYLNIKDLTRAGMVCRSWNEAALEEVRTRIRPQRIICNFNPKKKKYPDLKNVTDEIFIKPKIGFIFVGELAEFKKIWNYGNKAVSDCLCSRLPRDAEYFTVSNDGIVYDNLELEGGIITGIFLPDIPDVKIKSFLINTQDVMRFRKTSRRSNMRKLAREFCRISPNERNLKCVIMFLNRINGAVDPVQSDAKRILKALLPERSDDSKEKFSVWGGLTNMLGACNCTLEDSLCMKKSALAGITVSGSGVSAWSIILDSRIKTQAQAEKELTILKDAVELKKHSVGFMFACCGRGEDWYSEKHVESKIFKKLFPSVPLVGSFGGGEFGVSNVPQERLKDSTIAHEYSTIFLIISYGTIRKIL